MPALREQIVIDWWTPLVGLGGATPSPGVRSATVLLLVALTVAGCATGHPRSTSRLDDQPAAAERAADCHAQARAHEDSAVFRAALGTGLLAGGLMVVYGAAEGATWGALTGGGRGNGAWIGAAVGAGVGLIVGTVAGIERAREARSRYLVAVADCLASSGPDGASPVTSAVTGAAENGAVEPITVDVAE